VSLQVFQPAQFPTAVPHSPTRLPLLTFIYCRKAGRSSSRRAGLTAEEAAVHSPHLIPAGHSLAHADLELSLLIAFAPQRRVVSGGLTSSSTCTGFPSRCTKPRLEQARRNCLCLRSTGGTARKQREVFSCLAAAPLGAFPPRYRPVLTHLASPPTHISQPSQTLQGFSQASDEETMRTTAKISDNKVILSLHPSPS